MTVTLANLRSHITHAVSESTGLDTNLPGTSANDRVNRIVNDAGRWFYSHHPWNFRLRPPSELQFSEGGEYVELPEDFGEFVAHQMSNGLNYGFTMTTPSELAYYRSTTLTVTQNYYWGAVVWPTQDDISQGMDVPRLEVWPAMSSASQALVIWYRAKWLVLVNDDDAANVPEFAEWGLISAVREFAAGVQETHVAGKNVHERLAKLRASSIMQDAYSTDGLVEESLGPVRGGAIGRNFMRNWVAATSGAIADPS